MNNNDVAQDELQQAINNITNASNTSDSASVVSGMIGGASGSVDMPMPDFPAPSAPAVDLPMPETEVAEEKKEEVKPEPEIVSNKSNKASYGDPDLDKVRSKALTDIRPILEKIDLSPEKKFMVYRDIIDALNDKASFEPAYEAAGAIANEKERAEALLYIIEKIDSMGLKTEE